MRAILRWSWRHCTSVVFANARCACVSDRFPFAFRALPRECDDNWSHLGRSNSSLENAYAYAAELLSKAAGRAVTPLPRYIRRNELRQAVPLSDTTIYEMEQRREFPRRITLAPRVVVWNWAEVEAWIEQKRLDSEAGEAQLAHPGRP
jgi:prophage regulatory protein